MSAKQCKSAGEPQWLTSEDSGCAAVLQGLECPSPISEISYGLGELASLMSQLQNIVSLPQGPWWRMACSAAKGVPALELHVAGSDYAYQ